MFFNLIVRNSVTESDDASTRTISSATSASIGFILVLVFVVIFHRAMKRRQSSKNRSNGYRFLPKKTNCNPWLEPRREPDGCKENHYTSRPLVISLRGNYTSPHTANCQYDVFLSFADEDLPFVETHIYHQLEESGFQVCWHHRDFLPGYSIIENIKNSIDRSRRVLFVLSEHFHRYSQAYYVFVRQCKVCKATLEKICTTYL